MSNWDSQTRHRHAPRRDARGFTLIELLITVTVLIVVMGTLASVLYLSSRSKTATTNQIESGQSARVAMEMMTGDLRSAGYNTDMDFGAPQPQIAYVDSTQVLISADLLPYPQAMGSFAAPRAYDPAGTPRPDPLDGTPWQPPIKYRTGAEIIRYTLDANNDGVITAADQTDPNGSSAAGTKNPNDYVLVRQVFGDSTNNTPGDNGGSTEQIALVNKPGGAVPPMFTVYMKGSTTPWNWAGGPVPANQLNNIERIKVQVSSPSSKPDSKGNYAQTVLRSEVNSMRSVPNFGAPQYAVTGMVYDDQNSSHSPDAGEPGIPNVQVRLGPYSTYTTASGTFLFRVFAGTYTLKHTPVPGYQNYTFPDSFVLNVNTAMSRSFADIAMPGGNVSIHVFEDTNDNNAYDSGEPPVGSIVANLTPGPVTGTTDGFGLVSMFAAVGPYSVSLALPDSFIANTTPYPVTGTMTNGGTATYDIGIKKAATGTITGKVFLDANRDGAWSGSETGIQNVWVGVTNDGGSTIQGYARSNASGDYSISVPVNDPPHTTPYTVFCIPPGGNFPTGPTSIGNLWIQGSSTTPNNNFGMATFQIITLNASRVLSLASSDLIEGDWNGGHTENAVGDADLVLGADAGGTDNISIWFNNYPPAKGNNQNLFTSAPDYTRNAPQSVLSIALDTLDSDATWKRRPDVVTGTKINAAGNFFVWLNQNTNGNYGYLPTTYSTGMNYRTNDNGDVQSVLTLDCANGAMPDIIVGTKSPTAYYGTVEVWQNNDATTPTFTRSEIYPSAGGIPGGTMGEVNTMLLSDLDNDGNKDLIVGTKTGATAGELIIFQNVSKTTGNRFVCRAKYALTTDVATALATIDLNSDGKKDIIVGTEAGPASGRLKVFQSVSTIGTLWSFANVRNLAASGIVMTMGKSDLGGSSMDDLVVGWRATSTGYVGGIDVYFTSAVGLPPAGADPSAGAVVNMVPASCLGNFNYGLVPLASTPYLKDLAVGVKVSATTGALVVFIR